MFPLGSAHIKLTGKLFFTSEFMLDLRSRSYSVPDPLPTHQFPKTGSCVFPAPDTHAHLPGHWFVVSQHPLETDQ